jgi:hypothetical protein
MPELVVSSELGATLRGTFKDNGYALFEGVFSAQQAMLSMDATMQCALLQNCSAQNRIDRSIDSSKRIARICQIAFQSNAAQPIRRAVQEALRHTKSPILPAPMPVGICFRQVERWWRLAEAWMDRQWPAKNDPRRYNFEEAVGANHTVRMNTPCRCGFTSVCAHSCVDVVQCAAHACRESLICLGRTCDRRMHPSHIDRITHSRAHTRTHTRTHGCGWVGGCGCGCVRVRV